MDGTIARDSLLSDCRPRSSAEEGAVEDASGRRHAAGKVVELQLAAGDMGRPHLATGNRARDDGGVSNVPRKNRSACVVSLANLSRADGTGAQAAGQDMNWPQHARRYFPAGDDVGERLVSSEDV